MGFCVSAKKLMKEGVAVRLVFSIHITLHVTAVMIFNTKE